METALLFDTLKTSKHLQAAGFEQGQAEALTEEFKFVVESNFAKLSTKEQVAALEEQLKQKATKEQVAALENNLSERLEKFATKEDVQNVKDELKNDVQNVKDELKEDIHYLKGDQKLLKWMVSFGISLNLLTLGVVLAFLFTTTPTPA